MEAKAGWTNIFIYPGYRFKVLDALITNFHLPESTLIMLVSALAGREHVLAAYEEAVRERYRFFSFGTPCSSPDRAILVSSLRFINFCAKKMEHLLTFSAETDMIGSSGSRGDGR